MAIKEILDRIKTKLPADAGEEINALLADARREADTILDDLKSANSESKSRKDKLRELQSEIETLKTEAETLKSKQNTDEFKALQAKASEYDKLIADKNETLIKTWNEKSKVFALPETDPLSKKAAAVKGDFQFPETITPEIAEHNLKQFSLLEKTSYFQTDSGKPADYPHSNPGGAMPVSSGQATVNLVKKTQ